jgi:hypothetical protein
VITGFNTDVEHEGVVYHVQTEDKGLESPLILSLVYSGGAILASKRSRYEDLIANGFSDEALAERLKRQHTLICAAIHAGRLDELKRMGAADAESGSPQTAAESGPASDDFEVERSDARPRSDVPPTINVPETPLTVSKPDPSAAVIAAYTVHDPRRKSAAELQTIEEGVRLSLLDEHEFRSGDSLVLRIMLSHVSGDREKPLGGVKVSVKILGTTFKPQMYSMKTERDGIAIISAQIPDFTSGRAAILIRAVTNDMETELRRVIQPAGVN